jgi:hypothetical protein
MFSHDLILREQPQLPENWLPANVRLEVVTEFFVDADPVLRSAPYNAEGQPELKNDAVIHFGKMAMIMGKAFEVSGSKAFEFGGIDQPGSPVVKEWHRTYDGRRFLIESLSWPEAAPGLQNLRRSLRASAPHKSRNTALASLRRPLHRRDSQNKPVQVASVDYAPSGFLIDFVIVPDAGAPATLASGETYYIRTSYYSGSSVTVQPGAVIKYKNNANMLLYGPVSFPSSGVMPIFTSRNDDAFGDWIGGAGLDPYSEPDSDNNPASHRASKAIWIYYYGQGVSISNSRIRWAQIGFKRDRNAGQTSTSWISNCIFENITGTGSIGVSDTAYYLSASNLRKCNVTTPGASMTDDCNSVADPDNDRLINLQEAQYGTDPDLADTDGDALSDFAEIFGGNFGEADFVDLPGLGADPLHRDIFVEADYYANYGAGSVSLDPFPQSVSAVVNAFAAAPVMNPDGTTGINLHFIVDDGIDTTIYTTSQLSLSNTSVSNWSEVTFFKNIYFTPGREDYFHWCLFADRYGSTGSSGLAERPGDDFIVTLGPTYWGTATVQQESGTIMHELGHNLGLNHGGNEGANRKPNYLSVMNYNYQLRGLEVSGVNGVLDYSRLEIGSVTELRLSEINGFTPILPTTEADLGQYGVYIWSGSAMNRWAGWIDTTDGASANLDFNHNNNIQTSLVSQSLDEDDLIETHPASQNDWDHLIFHGGQIGEGFEALETAERVQCMTLNDL